MATVHEELLTLLAEVNKGLHGIIRMTWREYGLGRPGAIIMRMILGHPGITVSRLSRITGLAKSHVSNCVDALDENGFLSKGKDPNDGRLVLLYPTKKAKNHVEKMWAEALGNLSEVVGELPEEQLSAIIHALKTLRDLIDKDKN